MLADIKILKFHTSINKRKLGLVKKFLECCDISYSEDVETFVIAQEEYEIVGCGGIAGNILKCFAVSQKKRGQGVILSVMTELLNLAYSLGREKLFIFSKAKNKNLFEECGFNLIEQVDEALVFMENTHSIFDFKQELKKSLKRGDKIGSIVMNANPFTLGHRYLVKEASSQCDWLHIFVVEEDASYFSFEDRFSLVLEGVKEFKNVSVHKGGNYIISKATFPTYFLKDTKTIDSLYSKLDAQIFKNHIAPTLHVTHRFVGEEPYCVVTNEYNKQLQLILNNPNSSNQIEVVEIPRKEIDSRAISASHVRKLLEEEQFETLEKLVPESTFRHLVQNTNISTEEIRS